MSAVILSFPSYVKAQEKTEVPIPTYELKTKRPNERPGIRDRQTWEYHTQTMPEGEVDPVGVLTKLGENGWEIVAVVPSVKHAVTIYCKRPK